MKFIQNIVPMIYEFAISALILVFVIQVWKHYREKKSPVLRALFFFILFDGLSIFVAAFSRLLRYTNLWELSSGKKIELLSISMCFIAIANIFMQKFGNEVFGREQSKKNYKIFLQIYSGFVVVYIGFTLITGLFTVDLTTWIWAFIMILSLVVYIRVIYMALRLARKLENHADKRATQMLAGAPTALLFLFVSFLLDRIMGGDFTIFYYIGWAVSLIAVFLLILGIFRPRWVENLWKEK